MPVTRTQLNLIGAKQANTKFIKALEINKKSISAITFTKKNTIKSDGTIQRIISPASNEVAVYVQFPEKVTTEEYSLFENTNTLQDIVDLMHETNAILQYETTPTNEDYQINLPIETITNSLNPLVLESKQNLYTKGFSEQDIQQMIAEENAEEVDLIPFVMALTQTESNQTVAANSFPNFFVSSNYGEITWNEAAACAISALVFDFAGFGFASSATTWSMVAMKRAFKAVTKKALGPVGVMIAVAEFGFCLANNAS